MTDKSVIVVNKDKVAQIILNRPTKCNALNGDVVLRLQEAFFNADHDKHTQMVLLSGNGSHFCAGADMEAMSQLAQGSFENSREDARNLASLFLQMHTFTKPIITLAQGGVFGGGLGLLACSDIVIAAKNAVFAFSEVKLGLVPAVISPYVVSVIGVAAARYYFLTGQRFNTEEALELGLVHRRVPPEELGESGQALVSDLKQNSLTALTEVKRLMNLVTNEPISLELSEKTAEIFANLRVSAEGREGLAAFLAKRKPSWS